MQYSPDWRQQMTKAQFEKELSLMFLGPGIYTNGGDTVLIVPVHPLSRDTVWQQKQPTDLYEVQVWNCPSSDTLMSIVAVAPFRDIVKTD